MKEIKAPIVKKTVEIKGFDGLCTIEQWSPESALDIYHTMEVYNWAPWLAATPDSLAGRADIFPEGQLLLRGPNKEILASLSTNRISWDGQADSLPSWDQVAGDPTTYEKTYQPDGNALVLMSMNVVPKYKKNGLATTLVQEVQELAKELGVEYLIGSFRPSEFGNYKAENGLTPFTNYVSMKTKKPDGFVPFDAWIRSLTRNGMQPIKIDENAMCVTIDLLEFEELKKTYKPEIWKQTEVSIWECGEVGQWSIDEDANTAIYIESNVWGILPGTPGYKEITEQQTL